MHSSARTFAAIIRLMMEDEWSKSRLTERSGLHHVTVSRYVNALHNERVIRISSWQRPARGLGGLVPFYSFNDEDQPDARKPAKTAKTQAEASREYRQRKEAIRTLHLIAGRMS